MTAYEYRTVALPDFDRSAVLRYAKTREDPGELLDECLAQMKDLNGAVVFSQADVRIRGSVLDLGFCKTVSVDLAKALEGCDSILFFAATVGLMPDRLLAKYGRLSPSRALFLQAAATERIEAVCDAFCAERNDYYAERGFGLRPRFSPGYGDLSLSLQKDILTALDCRKTLGLTLTDSLLMIPSKSVTAIVGIYRK